jgi:DNA-binding MarR family transcriptional regulator
MSSKPKPGGTTATTDDEAMPPPPLESLIGFLLRCASNIADASYYKQVGSAEITPRQFAILLSLRNGGPMTQAALSAVTRMDRSTINEMVPRMLERNLISKSNSPNDKRAIHLSITAHGLKTLKELLPSTIRSQDMIVASLPKEYRRIFKHCLETIIEANEASLAE